MRHEDLAAYSFLKDRDVLTTHKILYRPHPLRTSEFLRKYISFDPDERSKYRIECILSPLSSSSTIELSEYVTPQLLLYKHPRYIAPNPLSQYNLSLKLVSQSSSYDVFNIQ